MPNSPDWIELLGWMLVHSVWQVASIVAITALTLASLRRASANARYVVGCVAMSFSLATLPISLTWVITNQAVKQIPEASKGLGSSQAVVGLPLELANAEAPSSSRSLDSALSGRMSLAAKSEAVQALKAVDHKFRGTPQEGSRANEPTAQSRFRTFLFLCVNGWLAGILLLSLRPFIGWGVAQRLRNDGLSDVSQSVRKAFDDLLKRLDFTCAIDIFQSSLVSIPCVIGASKPIILLPVSAITGLNSAQLEAVLVHELAHIRRHDHLINALQIVIETLLFYHPSIWWLSSQIRIEREHCCDDMVIGALENRVDYCRALLVIEELRGTSTKSLLVLGSTDGSLVSRIARITGFGTRDATIASATRWTMLFAGFLSFAIVLTIAGSTLVMPSPQAIGQSQPKLTIEEEVEPVKYNLQDQTEQENPRIRDATVNRPADETIERRPELPRFEPIEGEVVDKATGNRIEGATVRFRIRKAQLRPVIRNGQQSKVPILPADETEPEEELVYQNVGKFRFKLPERLKFSQCLIIETYAHHPDYMPRNSKRLLIGSQGLDHKVQAIEPTVIVEAVQKIELQLGEVVTGRVLDLDGSPAKAIPVTTGRNREGWQIGFESGTVTDTNGRFRMVVPPLERGQGRIYLTPIHAAAVSRAITPEFGEQQVFQLRRGTRLHGHVYDANGNGVPGGVIRANGGERIPWRFAMTDAAGHYSLPPIPYGEYTVELIDEGRIPEMKQLGAKLPDVYVSQTVSLAKTAPIEQSLDFHPHESVRVGVKYTNSNGSPVTGATLNLYGGIDRKNWFGSLREVVDQPGKYEIRVPRGMSCYQIGQMQMASVYEDGSLYFLRVLQRDERSRETKPFRGTTFQGDDDSLHILRFKAAHLTIRAFLKGEPFPFGNQGFGLQFADPQLAQELGLKLPTCGGAAIVDTSSGRLSVHPQIELRLKIEDARIEPWNKIVYLQEGEQRTIDVQLQPSNGQITEPNNDEPVIDRGATANLNDSEKFQQSLTISRDNSLVRRSMREITEVSFTDSPLKETLEYLSSLHNITIELDPSAQDVESQPVNLVMSNIRLENVLLLMLRGTDLSYFVDGGRLIIASREEVLRRGHLPPESFSEKLKRLSAYPNIPWEALLCSDHQNDVLLDTDSDAQKELIRRLTSLLVNDDSFVQIHAARSLYFFAERAKLAIANLKVLTESKDLDVRMEAYKTLAMIGHQDLETLTIIVDAWQKDPEIRNDWIFLLTQFDSGVCNELSKRYEGASAEFRLNIVVAAGVLPEEDGLRILLKGMKDSDPKVCSAATWRALNKGSEPTEEMVEILRDQLQHPSAVVQIDAASRLIFVELEFDRALEFLIKMFESEDPALRHRAAFAFSGVQVSPHGERVLNRLNELLVTAKPPVRAGVFNALGIMALAPKEYVAKRNTWGPATLNRRSRISIRESTENPDLVFRFEIEELEKSSLNVDARKEPITGMLRILGPDDEDFKTVDFGFSTDVGPDGNNPKTEIVREESLGRKKLGWIKKGRYRFQFVAPGIPHSNVATIVFDKDVD